VPIASCLSDYVHLNWHDAYPTRFLSFAASLRLEVVAEVLHEHRNAKPAGGTGRLGRPPLLDELDGNFAEPKPQLRPSRGLAHFPHKPYRKGNLLKLFAMAMGAVINSVHKFILEDFSYSLADGSVAVVRAGLGANPKP